MDMVAVAFSSQYSQFIDECSCANSIIGDPLCADKTLPSPIHDLYDVGAAVDIHADQ
jgi:hypothetical protein